MSISFIPTVWSARLLLNLHKALVYAQAGIVNKDYEGEITGAGNAVKIAAIGSITVGDYTKDTDIVDPEPITDSEQNLLIDQSKFFNFQVDDVDRAQAKISYLDSAMQEAAYALRDKQDSFVANIMDAGVASANRIGSSVTPVIPTKTDAYEYLVDLSVRLDESNCPSANRFCIVPSWFHGLLLKDDRFVKAGTPATDDVLRNGHVGMAAGLQIYMSNNVPNAAGTKYKIIAGHASATSVAEQIVSVEKFRMEKRFADGVKGLHVYGGKVLRPQWIAALVASKS
jgi:hypothetical protein